MSVCHITEDGYIWEEEVRPRPVRHVRGNSRKRKRRRKKGLILALLVVVSLTVALVLRWSSILPVDTGPVSRIAEIAANELGNGWEKYSQWWGAEGRLEWCAVFVCWCADQAGYQVDQDYLFSTGVNADVDYPMDNGAGAGSHARFHQKQERYRSRESGYEPKSGDLIYFDWDMDNMSEGVLVMDHIGLVEKVSWGRVYTIEGNSTDGEGTPDLVRRKSYAISDPRIRGYSDMSGITEWPEDEDSK